MATFDRERSEVVLRIVYDGAGTAGKTANLRALHASFNHRAQGDVYVPAETNTGRTLYFDAVELQAGYVDDLPLRCEVYSVPGQLALAERRYRLLRDADAVVVVCESTKWGVQAARSAWAFTEKVLIASGNGNVPVVVQASKQDLPGALSPTDVAEMLAFGRARRVMPASAVQGDGVRATFLAALDLAREVVRARLREGGPEALAPPLATSNQLYEAMLVDAGADAELAAEAIEAMVAVIASGARDPSPSR